MRQLDRYIVERSADLRPLTVWAYLSAARQSALHHAHTQKEDTVVVLERKGRRYFMEECRSR